MVANASLKRFKHHDALKSIILDNINSDPAVSVEDDEMSISNYDWESRQDDTRPWVKIIQPYLQEHFNQCARSEDCECAYIHDLWFQQYIKSDTHPWHVHSANFTGVYYLQFPEGSSTTQVIDHSKKTFDIDAKEGDIIVFPSFFIHRSPPIEHDVVKTIISFNIDFCDVLF